MPIDDCTGVILAGGNSSRFGSNKALAEINGVPLINFPRQVLEDLFSRRLLITNTPEEYGFIDWPIAADIHVGGGPLAGIHAALCSVETPFIFVAGCDMPFLDRGLIRYLHSLAEGFEAVVPRTANGLEPLHAIYSRKAIKTLAEALGEGQLKLHETLSHLNTRQVAEDELLRESANGLQSFRNINTTGDLADHV